MFTNLFGRYLEENGIITDEEFFSIKMERNKTKVKLGLIAVSEKLMTEKQADQVNRKPQRLDKRFGDIAVDMGFLTDTQVERLLALQGNPYMQFCQCVTDKGIMSLGQIEEALEGFQKANGFTSADIESIKSGDIDRIIPLYLPSLPEGPLIDLLLVIFRSIVRLVSTDLNLKKGYLTSDYQMDIHAIQAMKGDYNAATAFSGDDKGILALAEGFAKEFFNEVSIDALDSAGEFINIANGLFATAKSYEGMEINLEPPTYSKDPVEISGSSLYIVPIEINQQELSLIIKLS